MKYTIILFFIFFLTNAYPFAFNKMKLGDTIFNNIKSYDNHDKIILDTNNTVSNEGLEGICKPYSDDTIDIIKIKENMIRKELLQVLLDKNKSINQKLDLIKHYEPLIYNLTSANINLHNGRLLDDWETNIF